MLLYVPFVTCCHWSLASQSLTLRWPCDGGRDVMVEGAASSISNAHVHLQVCAFGGKPTPLCDTTSGVKGVVPRLPSIKRWAWPQLAAAGAWGVPCPVPWLPHDAQCNHIGVTKSPFLKISLYIIGLGTLAILGVLHKCR